jgi:hypothetical protein
VKELTLRPAVSSPADILTGDALNWSASSPMLPFAMTNPL